MTTRPISQIIADLKATCAPESDVGLVCEFAESMLLSTVASIWMNKTALTQCVSELRHDLHLANNNAEIYNRVAREAKEQLAVVTAERDAIKRSRAQEEDYAQMAYAWGQAKERCALLEEALKAYDCKCVTTKDPRRYEPLTKCERCKALGYPNIESWSET